MLRTPRIGNVKSSVVRWTRPGLDLGALRTLARVPKRTPGRYWVVEKLELAGETAAKMDPRVG